MTAGYGQRIPITDPGLRTQIGHRTTCGFAERVASLVRADLYNRPADTSISLTVYSSITKENRPVACTVQGDLATCLVNNTSETIYVSRQDTSG